MPRLYSHARGHALRPGVAVTPFALAGPHVEYRNAIVSDGEGHSLLVAGRPDTPSSALLVLNDQQLPAGAMVVARGDVREGGIGLAMFRDGRVIDGVEVTGHGGFEAALEVPAAGRYTVELSNRVRARRRPRNDVTITALGWMPAEAAMAGGGVR
jgi:hypothetical protein